MLVAGFGQLADKLLVHLAAGLLVYFLYFPLLQHSVEGGSLFIHQTVGRNMLHTQIDGCSDVALPVG